MAGELVVGYDGSEGARAALTHATELAREPFGEIQTEEDENAKPGIVTIKVEGEGVGELPEAAATITTEDYGFVTEGLKAGRNTVKFDNVGKEPHHVIALPFTPGATLEEVKKAFESEEEPAGPPPVDFMKGTSTTVITGGQAQVADLELQKGKYALICFISDRAGGPPHVADDRRGGRPLT